MASWILRAARVAVYVLSMAWVALVAMRDAAPDTVGPSGQRAMASRDGAPVCLSLYTSGFLEDGDAAAPLAEVARTELARPLDELREAAHMTMCLIAVVALAASAAAAISATNKGRGSNRPAARTLLCVAQIACGFCAVLHGLLVSQRSAQLLDGSGAAANAMAKHGYRLGWAAHATGFWVVAPLFLVVVGFAFLTRKSNPHGLILLLASLYIPVVASAYASPAWFVRDGWLGTAPAEPWAGPETIGLHAACSPTGVRDATGSVGFVHSTQAIPTGALVAFAASSGVVASELADFAGAPVLAAATHVPSLFGPAVWALLPPRMWFIGEGEALLAPSVLLLALVARAVVLLESL